MFFKVHPWLIKKKFENPKAKNTIKDKGQWFDFICFSKRKAWIPDGKKLKANIIERKIIFLHIHQGSLSYSFFSGGIKISQMQIYVSFEF